MTASRVGRLHVITDCRLQQVHDHVALARLAADGGADAVQFREKRADPPQPIEQTVRSLRAALRSFHVQLIVNDHVDAAVAAGADGVHLGRADLPPRIARARLGRRRLIGRTANSLEQALAATHEPVDYLGVGPVFGTSSKARPAPTLGLDGLRRITRAVDRPVIAIGGITPDTVGDVLDCGVHGIAVLSAVVCAENPAAATRAFREALDGQLSGKREHETTRRYDF